MLRKITELVDKDVAANSKPISMIGAVIPFIPFMLFVDGAPFDSHPALGGAAFAASCCWILFVMWRVLRHAKAKFDGFGYVIGSFHFWRLIIWVGLLISLITAAIMWIEKYSG